MKDIDPYTIIGGNFAKPTRKRFPVSYIEAFLNLQWWQLPIEKVTGHVNTFAGNDAEELFHLKDLN